MPLLWSPQVTTSECDRTRIRRLQAMAVRRWPSVIVPWMVSRRRVLRQGPGPKGYSIWDPIAIDDGTKVPIIGIEEGYRTSSPRHRNRFRCSFGHESGMRTPALFGQPRRAVIGGRDARNKEARV